MEVLRRIETEVLSTRTRIDDLISRMGSLESRHEATAARTTVQMASYEKDYEALLSQVRALEARQTSIRADLDQARGVVRLGAWLGPGSVAALIFYLATHQPEPQQGPYGPAQGEASAEHPADNPSRK